MHVEIGVEIPRDDDAIPRSGLPRIALRHHLALRELGLFNSCHFVCCIQWHLHDTCQPTLSILLLSSNPIVGKHSPLQVRWCRVQLLFFGRGSGHLVTLAFLLLHLLFDVPEHVGVNVACISLCCEVDSSVWSSSSSTT